MNVARIRSLSLFLLPALLLMPACALFPRDYQPSIKEVTPRVENLDLQGIDLLLDLTVNNPLPVAIPSPDIRYNLLVEGKPLLTEQTMQAQSLASRSESVATVPLRLYYLDLISAAGGLADTNEVNYSLEGFMDLGQVQGMESPLSLPFKEEGTLPILKAPRFSIAELGAPGISLSGFTMNLKTRVENPNAFPIDVRNLGYALQAGGVKLGDLSVGSSEKIPAEGDAVLDLSGTFSASRAMAEMLQLERDPTALSIVPRGSIQTPYGPIDLAKLLKSYPLPGMGNSTSTGQIPAPRAAP